MTGHGSTWAVPNGALAHRSINDPTDLAFSTAGRQPGRPSRTGPDRGIQMERRGVLPSLQQRSQTRLQPGPQAHCLVPARHLGHGHQRPPVLPAAGPRPNPGAPGRGDSGEADKPRHNGGLPTREDQVPRRGPDEPDELAPLTVIEIRRLNAHLHQPRHPLRHRTQWSRWRRRR